MSLRLTNSEMRDFRRCRRRWYLGYYRCLGKPESEDFNKPLGIGSRVHEALADYYRPGLKRNPKRAMTNFRKKVKADVEEHPSLQENIYKEADLCEAMLSGYFEWVEEEGADEDLKVVEPEAEVEVPLFDDVTILSKIDARVERLSDNKRGALEHKTVAEFKTPLPRLQTDTQLLTEHLVEYLLLLEEEPERAKAQKKGTVDSRAEFVLYNMLRKVKRTKTANPPFYQRETVRHNIHELRSHWRHVASIAMEILETRARLDAGGEHHDVVPPNPTADCSWDCAFRGPCLAGLFDDGSDVEAHLADEFQVGDPLERYRKSVGLPSEKPAEATEPVE